MGCVMPRRGMGQLQAEVLDVLWDRGGWLTPGEVRDALGGRPPLAYSTVMTILRRLWKKGQVERERDGKAFAYHALTSREEHMAERMREMLGAAHDPASALGHFVAKLGTEHQAQLRRILKRQQRS